MKTLEYKRIHKSGHKKFCTMEFNEAHTVVLDFGKKYGGKLKLPTAFLADAVEHYLTHVIKLGLKGEKNATKKGK